MLLNQTLDLRQLSARKAEVARESDGRDPELRGAIVPVHVNVRRLVGLMAIEVYAVRPRLSTVAIDGASYRGRQRPPKPLLGEDPADASPGPEKSRLQPSR